MPASGPEAGRNPGVAARSYDRIWRRLREKTPTIYERTWRTTRGAELDLGALLADRVALHGALAYNNGKHVTFPNAIPPFELAGGPERVDISGSALPGLPKWSFSLAGDYLVPLAGGRELAGGLDTSYRSSYSSSTTPSDYLFADGYALVNARVGLRAENGWSVTVWSRNVLDKDYLEQLGAAGGSGLYWGIPGEPRTFGVTVRRGP